MTTKQGEWLIAVDADGEYAERGLYGSIVQRDLEREGRYMGPAGWAGIRMAGILADGITVRAPKNREEKKAVESVSKSSEIASRMGQAHTDAQYVAIRGHRP